MCTFGIQTCSFFPIFSTHCSIHIYFHFRATCFASANNTGKIRFGSLTDSFLLQSRSKSFHLSSETHFFFHVFTFSFLLRFIFSNRDEQKMAVNEDSVESLRLRFFEQVHVYNSINCNSELEQ